MQISDQERIIALLVVQAQAEISATLSNADSQDNKALGLLAIDVVAIGGLIANRSALDRFWYAPIGGLVLSVGLFVATILPRRFPVGPSLRPFYKMVISGRSLGASVALLDALTRAIGVTRQNADRKSNLWLVGLVVMIATAMLGAVSLVVVR